MLFPNEHHNKEDKLLISLPIDRPLTFLWLGKETTMSDNWIHYSRRLHEYELMIVDQGTLYIADEYGKYKVTEGEYILMSPCLHQYGWKPSACSFYWLHFHFPEADCVDASSSRKTSFFPIPKQARIPDVSAIQTYLSQMSHNEQFYSDTTQSSFLLSALLLEIHNQLYGSSSASSFSNDHPSLQKADLCKKIKNYVFWNRTHRIRICDIASYMRYSEKYLSSVFAEYTGTTLKTYLDEQRMAAARELLANSHNTIREIAFQLGYSDSHNFSRAFKRVTGMSPKDYRISSGKNKTRP